MSVQASKIVARNLVEAEISPNVAGAPFAQDVDWVCH
jgi:hypothetical protein